MQIFDSVFLHILRPLVKSCLTVRSVQYISCQSNQLVYADQPHIHKVQYICLALYFSMVVPPRGCVYCEWQVYSLEMGHPSSTNMYICECQINSGLLFALLLSHWGQSFFACPCSAAMQLCVRQCKAPK